MNEERMFHIGLPVTVHANYALLPGDPGRVPKIAAYLENPHELGCNREFRTWSGTLGGETVLVTSTGIGGPSASIAVEELITLGVTHFVRIGTCGGMNETVCAGDVVIATGAIRMEGTSREYLPIEFPAVADFGLVRDLVDGAAAVGVPFHTGVVQSKDSFYGQHSPERMPNGAELLRKWDAWMAGGCLASEMEAAAIYAVAAARGVKAATVLHVIWNQMRRDRLGDHREVHDTDPAIRTAIEGLKRTIMRNSSPNP
ncbi:MAG: nucleoside phosphorylase [Clostridia bacterium]|nr:nucleoside phosphorylase [Clostridia bacterium]